MQMQFKACPQCSQSMPEDAAVCMRCGHQFNNPYQNPPYAGQPNYSVPYPHAPPRAGPSGLSIASLVLGIVGLMSICFWFISGPCSLLAVIFGILSLKGEGRGMAIAGLICGGIAV